MLYQLSYSRMKLLRFRPVSVGSIEPEEFYQLGLGKLSVFDDPLNRLYGAPNLLRGLPRIDDITVLRRNLVRPLRQT